MDYDKMEDAITEKTKAIIPVDIGGVLCDYDRILEAVERKKNLFKAEGRVQEALGRVAVVADSAHALGAVRNGKKAGEIADFTSFSFHAVKNLTTAEGGAATWRTIPGIDDEDIYKQYSLYSLHGQSKDALAKTSAGAWEYDIVGTWYKCNMTDIMAAMGLKQLERYPNMLEKRKEYTKKYDHMCQELGLKKLEHFTEDGEGSCHLYLVRVPGITSEQRNEIIEKMAERGISCNVHYKPLPMMSAYKAMGWDIKDFPESYKIFENEITLPLNTRMTEEDVDYVIENLKEIVKCY
jgi:dTDP-4-amino-4,6-dideoxygalactose transaminase